MNLLDRLLRRTRALGTATVPPRRDGTTAQVTTQVTATIDRALDAAGIAPQARTGVDIRGTIDRALAQAGLVQPASADGAPAPAARAHGVPRATAPATGGQWIARTFSNDAGTRRYMLYVPAAYAAGAHKPMPLIVMLHGCTQSPEDFAAGTRMNALAEARGFLVAYPAQTPKANGNRCWNWFRAGDQARGQGEPSLIAGIAQHVATDYRIDPRRVFVAGLSAGAAMAVILGQTYPDVFAGVGAHSGLPFAAAHDVASAFNAMKAPPSRQSAHASTTGKVPTIVFHGDADHTVAVGNGDEIVGDATARATDSAVYGGAVPGGRSYTQKVFIDAAGRPRAEYWRIHGGGHAWSGGSTQGSYTDPTGPDASAEMVRFFLQLPVAAQ